MPVKTQLKFLKDGMKRWARGMELTSSKCVCNTTQENNALP